MIAGEIRGTLGAGGNVGRFKSILGINDGNSGNLGGDGIWGIDGILGAHDKFHADTVKSILIDGGAGNSGNAGSVIVFGTKWIFGKTTSNQRRIWLKSIKIFGNLNGGIARIGNFGHNNERVQE